MVVSYTRGCHVERSLHYSNVPSIKLKNLNISLSQKSYLDPRLVRSRRHLDLACRHAEEQIPNLAWRWGVGNTEVWGKNSETEFSL